MNGKKNARELTDWLLDYPEQEWDHLIEEWCGEDDALKQEVYTLAKSNRNARDFVEELQKRIYTLTKSSLMSGKYDPEQIGGYKVVRKLGSGGSAVVYLVEKEGKRFALKLLKGVMEESSRHRFESEQKILATLNHPNIARFIEGGFTNEDIPYVIMEFVDGETIDSWCDRNRLGIDDRIGLFQTVCQALHVAHQNLVVHRDIKPEHILITPDGELKLIDFGIAKLLEPADSMAIRFKTHTGVRLMTPDYASPEQICGRPITTASDIYSLGVVLYQLLTGRRPYELGSTSLLEIERIACKTEPFKPSDAAAGAKLPAVSGTNAKLPVYKPEETARLRNLDKEQFVKKLSGDLDRIVLKTLRKEPEQRYASVLALSDDLEKYMRGEPILARAPTIRYRARKFVLRHRFTVSAALIVILTLVTGLVSTLWQAQQARQNAYQAEIEAQRARLVTDFLINLFESGDPGINQGEEITLNQLLEKGVEQALETGLEPSLQLNLLTVLGRVYSGMGMYGTSSEILESALDIAEAENPMDLLVIADIQSRLGYNARIMGRLALADSLYLKALENYREELGENHLSTIQSLEDWAGIRAYLSRDTELADSLFQDVVNRRRMVLDTFDQKLAESLNNLGYIKLTKGEYHLALENYQEASEIYRVTSGEHHPDRLRVMSSMAVANYRIGNYGRAEQMYNEVIEIRTRVLGDNHPQVAISKYHLAELLNDTGRLEEAIPVNQSAVQIMENLDAPHQFYPDILFSRAGFLNLSGNISSAAKAYHQTAQSCMEIRGISSPGCSRIFIAAGEFFLGQQQPGEARTYLQYAYDSMSTRFEEGHEELIRLEELLVLVNNDD